jgi:hypothetical protein
MFSLMLSVVGFVAMIGIVTSTPDDRHDFQFLALVAGAILWGILATTTITARFMQWRISMRLTSVTRVRCVWAEESVLGSGWEGFFQGQ